MGIYIPNMEMPKDGHCIVRIYASGDVCEPTPCAGVWNKVAEAVPLPEGHGRLGDLDKLDYAFTALRFNEDGSLNHWDDRKNWCLHGNEIETILANAPTIVPAEGGTDDV